MKKKRKESKKIIWIKSRMSYLAVVQINFIIVKGLLWAFQFECKNCSSGRERFNKKFKVIMVFRLAQDKNLEMEMESYLGESQALL